MCSKYNGWTNYQTWNYNLWIDNEQGLYNYWRERAKELSKEENSKYHLSEELKSELEDNNPIQEAGVYSDLLGAAISSIDFYKIAENLLDEVEEEAGALS